MKSLGRAVLLGLAGVAISPAHAQSADQEAQRDPSIANLPRQGYEPRTIVIGNTEILPTLDAGVTYDDNIFATPDRRQGDAVFNLKPRVMAERKTPTSDIRADVHADINRYASTPREDVNAFGAKLDATRALSGEQTVTADLAFDRTFERRSDPEADLDRSRPPALINLATGELTYRYEGPRFGVVLDGSVSDLNYLPAADADRDMITYRGSFQASVNLRKGIAFFVQPFINRRDLRVDANRASIFGDTTTIGVLSGLSFNLSGKLEGNLGVGVFRANPDAAGVASFTGVSANGRVVWRPKIRTTITLEVFRGDAATVRAGALGRVDTRVGFSIDQEVRHNVIGHVALGIRNIHYLGGIDNDQRFKMGEVEGRYLFNRYLSGVLNVNYTRRGAAVPAERFNRVQTTLVYA